eukprot:Em0015g503a
MQITELDDGLLKCADLQELILTGNHLTSVPLHYLPPNLKVLELCYNELETTSDLCISSLELIHLGLAYNKLSALDLQPSNCTLVSAVRSQDQCTSKLASAVRSQDQCTSILASAVRSQDQCTSILASADELECNMVIRSFLFPRSSLLSLDLSYNRLADLPAVIKVIAELKQLCNLSLKGNPLTLVPCYHGYTVDSLAGITSLDDSEITALEREKASGMADLCEKQTELIMCARVHFQVKILNGLPELEEVGVEGCFGYAHHCY